MPRCQPPFAGPAGFASNLQYYKDGRRHLKAAQKAFPDLSRADALIAAQSAGGPLDPSSVAKYRGDLKRVLLAILRKERSLDEFDVIWAELDAALSKRQARIPRDKKRTSALKVKDATETEVHALFCELKRHAIATGNMNAVLAALFTLVAAHSGFRPCELIGGQLAGTTLVLPNAKRRPGQEGERSINLDGLHPDVVAGMALLLSLVPTDMRQLEFKAWHKQMAEQMRRACIRIGIRPLAPYSFRHVAIASWARAGLTPTEIAALVGHQSVRTHRTQYARSNVGHDRRAVARPTMDVVADTKAPDNHAAEKKDSPRSPERLDSSTSLIEINDIPVPKAKRQSSKRGVSSAAEVAVAKHRWSGLDMQNGKAKLAANRDHAHDESGRPVLHTKR
jgi:integrase